MYAGLVFFAVGVAAICHYFLFASLLHFSKHKYLFPFIQSFVGKIEREIVEFGIEKKEWMEKRKWEWEDGMRQRKRERAGKAMKHWQKQSEIENSLERFAALQWWPTKFPFVDAIWFLSRDLISKSKSSRNTIWTPPWTRTAHKTSIIVMVFFYIRAVGDDLWHADRHFSQGNCVIGARFK